MLVLPQPSWFHPSSISRARQARTTLHWTGQATSAGHDAQHSMPAKRGVASPAHFQTGERSRPWRLAVFAAATNSTTAVLTGSHHARFRLPRSLAGRTELHQNREIDAVRAGDELRRDPQHRRFESPPQRCGDPASWPVLDARKSAHCPGGHQAYAGKPKNLFVWSLRWGDEMKLSDTWSKRRCFPLVRSWMPETFGQVHESTVQL